MCRVCGSAEETIVHLLAACPTLAPTAYLHHHNLVAAVIHWHLMRFYSFQSRSRSWYSHKPPLVIESPTAKILWDFRLVSTLNHASKYIILTLYFTIFASKRYSLMRFLAQQTLMLLLKKMKRLLPGSRFPSDV